MTYDADAKKLAVKVIGTVESNLDYQAVNYNDPITVGIAQWYGTRAAAILEEMRTTNAGEWYGVQASIANQLATIPSSDTWWNSRRLTYDEGVSLRGVLGRNQVIQNARLSADLDAYVTVFESYGFDADAHTDTLIYFMSMHHQGPALALDVVTTLDTECTLEQMHAACLANPTFGQYGSRYQVTYDLINEFDFSGVDPVIPPDPDPVQVNGNARHITMQGDLLLVQFRDEEIVTFYPSGPNRWMPRKAVDAPIPPNPVDPPPPPGTGDWFHPLPGGSVTSPYGPRDGGFHWGADVATSGGSGGTVVAVTDLVITTAVDAYEGGNSTAGTYVKGHTLDGAYTFSYAHGQDETLAVTVGDTVAAGATLFIEGDTGYTFGRHCHLECYEGSLTDPWAPPYGNPIDPLPVLRAHGVVI